LIISIVIFSFIVTHLHSQGLSGNSCGGLSLLDENTCEYFFYNGLDNMKGAIKIHHSNSKYKDYIFQYDGIDDFEYMFSYYNEDLIRIFQLTELENS